jgi:arabinan endo-1,5-alpha-L-arabinosidase
MKPTLILISIIATLLAIAAVAPAQVGDVTNIHDPSIIQAGNTYYLFCTGRGIGVRTSTDLFNWKRAGRVFDQTPDWTRAYLPPVNPMRGSSLWAPDISVWDGEYRLYYAVSSFGKTASAIGLATNTTLDPADAKYKWVDRGKVIDTPAHNNWNAIDPCAFADADGNAWMVLGSCWTGLKLVSLDRKTGLLADAKAAPIAVAAHPPTNIIEEGFIRRHGDFYYLWESVDHCCRGVDSDYRIWVGRSKQVRGPYLDRDGRPMTEGGGTLVLASYDNVRGPGSCAIIAAMGNDYLIHHEYDAANPMNPGTPTLQIRRLFWAADGWPVAGEPIVRAPSAHAPSAGAPSEKPQASKPLTGDWMLRYDFGQAKKISLNADGRILPGDGDWKLEASRLTLSWHRAATTRVDDCTVSDDGSFFVGRDADGRVVNGVRP